MKTAGNHYSSGPFSVETGSARSPRPAPMSGEQRLFLVLGGLASLTLLATAAWLQPDPRGLGTHEQLGLPPCTLQTLWGVRCPSCGMTTAWSHAVRGRVDRALRANAGGALLAVVAIIAGPWALASGSVGRWLLVRPHDYVVLGVCLASLAVTLIDWASRLVWTLGK